MWRVMNTDDETVGVTANAAQAVDMLIRLCDDGNRGFRAVCEAKRLAGDDGADEVGSVIEWSRPVGGYVKTSPGAEAPLDHNPYVDAEAWPSEGGDDA